MPEIQTAIIGAGVIGLAIARALSMAGQEIIILEAEPHFGTATSARNSGVIHAGIYYPSNPLKAELCVQGRHLLYEYCAAKNLPHCRTGKLIFAHTQAQIPALHAIQRNAQAAGVHNLALLSSAAAQALEPALRCAAALLSPATGIIDQHAYMLALLADAEAHGATLACNARIENITRHNNLWAVHLEGEPEPALHARFIINAAGLGAQSLARNIAGLAPDKIPALYLAKGNYFSYAGKTPFRHLIYPIPEPGGLGTHLTLNLSGQAQFGPDVEWIAHPSYQVDPARHEAFTAAARRIWPELEPARLTPGYAGIRPKLAGPGKPAADFRIDGEAFHHLPGLVNLFGIESPGLTASLAIANRVLALLS